MKVEERQVQPRYKNAKKVYDEYVKSQDNNTTIDPFLFFSLNGITVEIVGLFSGNWAYQLSLSGICILKSKDFDGGIWHHQRKKIQKASLIAAFILLELRLAKKEIDKDLIWQLANEIPQF